MKQYFLKLDLNQPKNKAQEKAQEYYKQYADCLMDENSLKQFQNDIPAILEKINQANPRCTDIHHYIDDNWRYKKEEIIHIDAGIIIRSRQVLTYKNKTITSLVEECDLPDDFEEKLYNYTELKVKMARGELSVDELDEMWNLEAWFDDENWVD